MRNYREKLLIALREKIALWDKNLCAEDYALDEFYRAISDLPDRPEKDLPLIGFFTQTSKFRRLFNGITIPEFQLHQGNYQNINCPVLGDIVITGGFMESHGHSRKAQQKAIFADGELKILPPSDRNLGVDYVACWIRAWYSGTCTKIVVERGYGLRAYFRWDLNYLFEGQEYAVFGAFAHAKSFQVNEGARVKQGDILGLMGSSGGNYAPHIDYRQWISIEGVIVDLSPNALEVQLHG